MRKLHLINISPDRSDALRESSQLINQNDALVFYEDAILFCKNTVRNRALFSECFDDKKCYVLIADMSARGLKVEDCLVGVSPIDYDQWVELTEEYDGTHSWN